MSRVCQVTGKKNQFGNNVSHANNKTRRIFRPNLQTVRLYSETLKRMVTMRVTAAGLRTLEHKGGLDAFLLDSKNEDLTPTLRKMKTQLKAMNSATAASA